MRFVSVGKVWAHTVVLIWVCVQTGCGGEMACRGPVSDDCRMRGGVAEAAATAATAATVWTVTGCRVNGCVLPYRCNTTTGFCDRIPCGEGRGQCPPGYTCDVDAEICR